MSKLKNRTEDFFLKVGNKMSKFKNGKLKL